MRTHTLIAAAIACLSLPSQAQAPVVIPRPPIESPPSIAPPRIEIRQPDVGPMQTREMSVSTRIRLTYTTPLVTADNGDAALLLPIPREPIAKLNVAIETLDQWVRHRIEPPASLPDLRRQWRQSMKAWENPTHNSPHSASNRSSHSGRNGSPGGRPISPRPRLR